RDVHRVVRPRLLPLLELLREPHVVDELVFGPGLPGRIVLRVFLDPVHHAAVAALRGLPLQAQLEVLVLRVGHEVGALVAAVVALGADRLQRAVLDRPRARGLAVVAVPALRALAVEEELPAGGLLRVGEDVRTRAPGGGGGVRASASASGHGRPEGPRRPCPSESLLHGLLSVRAYSCPTRALAESPRSTSAAHR